MTAPFSQADQRPSLLVFVRHGQSLRNAFDLHAGLANVPQAVAETPDHLIPLTAEGEQQALATGLGLRAEFGTFDRIFHSPWLRTTQTAQLIARAFVDPIPLRRSLFLLEQNFGQLDPAIWPQQFDRYETAFRWFEHQREIMGRFYCRPPEGESWADVCMRTHQMLGVLFHPEYAGKRLLVVTHGVPLQSFRYHLEHPTEEELVAEYQATGVLNCGVAAYRWTPDAGWRLLFWNRQYPVG